MSLMLTCFSCIWLSVTPWTMEPTPCPCLCDFPGKDTWMGCHFLLQGIFSTWRPKLVSRGSYTGRQILYYLTSWASQVTQWQIIYLPKQKMWVQAKWGRASGRRNGNPFRYSCLGNPLERGTWWATVHRVAESDMTEHAHMHLTSYDRSIYPWTHNHNQDNELQGFPISLCSLSLPPTKPTQPLIYFLLI